MAIEDLVGLLIVLNFVLFLALERFFPARKYPARKLWRVRGFAFLILMAAIGTALPLLLPVSWLAAHRIMDLSHLSLGVGAVLGYVGVSFFFYWYHRASHRFDLMWRGLHQMHHAPARMDMGGAAVFHPLEMCVFVGFNTVLTTLVLGLSPEAAAITGFIAQFYSFFQHLNVRTPRWLGFIIQRPEAHFVHHEKEVHAFNYGDLPIWDMLFSTFNNPSHFGDGAVGFSEPADGQYGAMLRFNDVSGAVGTAIQKQARGAAAASPVVAPAASNC